MPEGKGYNIMGWWLATGKLGTINGMDINKVTTARLHEELAVGAQRLLVAAAKVAFADLVDRHPEYAEDILELRQVIRSFFKFDNPEQ